MDSSVNTTLTKLEQSFVRETVYMFTTLRHSFVLRKKKLTLILLKAGCEVAVNLKDKTFLKPVWKIMLPFIVKIFEVLV